MKRLGVYFAYSHLIVQMIRHQIIFYTFSDHVTFMDYFLPNSYKFRQRDKNIVYSHLWSL